MWRSGQDDKEPLYRKPIRWNHAGTFDDRPFCLEILMTVLFLTIEGAAGL